MGYIKGRDRKRIVYILIIVILIIVFAGCTGTNSSRYPVIEKGQLDLTNWEFNRNNKINLDGEWEFYWNRLLTHEELERDTPDLIAWQPDTWSEYSLNGIKLPGKGYGTYRLNVDTALPPDTKLGLRIHSFSSAYEVYVNNNLIASNGRVGMTAEEEIGEYRPQAAIFDLPASEFDIIIHVSNFHHSRGGFWYTVSMGSAEGIQNLHDSLMIKEAVLIGALLMIVLFFTAVYLMSKELKYILYFAFLCLTLAVVVDMLGQFILPRIFPGLSFNTIIFIWFSSTTWLLFFMILFVHELFPSQVSRVIFKGYLILCILFQLLYLFTSPIFYTNFARIINYIEIGGVVCTIIIVAIGIKNGQKSGWLNIFSMIIALITYVHDVLYFTNVIRSDFGEILFGGIFLFIFIQMVIQAQRIQCFLEEKTAADLAFLQAQIKPHFLYNALNTFIAISHYDMEKARNLLADLSNYLRKSFDFKGLSQFVPLKDEIQLAKAYIAIEKARFEERLEVSFIVHDDLETRVPSLMLQPIIENAVVHGILPKPEGGSVHIYINKDEKKLIFSVKDNGIGMTEEKLRKILNSDSRKGVGIANINGRLRKLYGNELNIISVPHFGTEITWTIPIS